MMDWNKAIFSHCALLHLFKVWG